MPTDVLAIMATVDLGDERVRALTGEVRRSFGRAASHLPFVRKVHSTLTP